MCYVAVRRESWMKKVGIVGKRKGTRSENENSILPFLAVFFYLTFAHILAPFYPCPGLLLIC